MRRHILPLVAAIATTSTAALSDDTTTDSLAALSVTWPSAMFVVGVDNAGNVTGRGGQVRVSRHLSNTAWCDKVDRLDLSLSQNKVQPYREIRHSPTPDIRLNLCNFNEGDATFNLVFPGSLDPGDILTIYKKWISDCQSRDPKLGQQTTTHPFNPDLFRLYVRYANGHTDSYDHHLPPVVLDCAPCPALAVKGEVELMENAPASVALGSIVSGGVAPYTVKFSNPPCSTYVNPSGVVVRTGGFCGSLFSGVLPTGVSQGSGQTLLSGTPQNAGSWKAVIEVTDSCRSGTNKVTKDFTFRVTDPTPPTLSGLSISPSTLPATGGDVVFRVTASDDRGVADVGAAMSGSGWSMRLTVARVSGNEKSGVWQGTYRAAPNTTTQSVPYTLELTATDASGNHARVLTQTFVVQGVPVTPHYKN